MAGDDNDEPMLEGPPTASATSGATAAAPKKPRRRFVPEVVETTVRSSNSSKRIIPEPTKEAPATEAPSRPVPAEPARASAPTTSRSTKDASVQVNDTEMPDAPPSAARQQKRRFAPVPIETTYDSYRVTEAAKQTRAHMQNQNPMGPTAELTPEPSPTTPHMPQLPVVSQAARASNQVPGRPKRRFAPQLIETSRRSRRDGQEGPATKPTDKTDITPGTNHIYAPKPKRKLPGPRTTTNSNSTTAPAASATADTSEDEGHDASARFLNPRRQQSMKPHPNTRRTTRNSSFHPGLETIASSGSSSEEEPEPDSDKDEADHHHHHGVVPKKAEPAPAKARSVASEGDGESWTSRNYQLRDRRESCDEEFSGYLLAVAAREAYRQRELEQAMSAFPNGLPLEGVEHFFMRDDDSEGEPQILGDPDEPLRHGTSQLLRRKSTEVNWAFKEMQQHAEVRYDRRSSSHMSIDEDLDQLDIAPPPADPLWTTSHARADSRQRQYSGASTSSPRLNATPPPAAEGLGAFRSGPFAKPFANPFAIFHNDDKEETLLRRMRKAASPPMLGGDLQFRRCPSPKLTRMEPDHPYPMVAELARPEERQRDVSEATGLWRGYCVAKTNEIVVTPLLDHQRPPLIATPMEPSTPADPFSDSFGSTLDVLNGATSPRTPLSPHQRGGMHQVLDERLRKEKARKDREAVIRTEFDDAFITQVYNYISLGYPATARAYDEELSKISGLAMAELRRDDGVKVQKGFMLDMELKVPADTADSETDEEKLRTPEEDEKRDLVRPPRWRALKLYIREWARQHPNLGDDSNPMAWGVRARRGSWAI